MAAGGTRGGIATAAIAYAAAALAAAIGGFEHEARACSCAPPAAVLVTPDRVDDAPLGAKLRIELGADDAGSELLVRTAAGAEVATTIAQKKTLGTVTQLELAPSAPLAARTQYEVALKKPDRHPSVIVFGTFRTGDARDVTPPTFDAPGIVTAFRRQNAASAACQVPGPWVTVDGVRAEDPGRPAARDRHRARVVELCGAW